MKTIICVCFLAMAAVALARPNEQYTDKYDNVDLDEMIRNPRLMHPYIKCMLDQGKCSPDAKELKEHIPEALENKCAKCNDKQKNGTERIIKHLINHEKDYWQQLVAKYDPEHKYTTKYEEELKKVKA